MACATRPVNLVIKPDEGYSVAITIETVDGTPVEFTNNDGNVSFTMPASDVIVHAVFSEEAPAYTIGYDIVGSGQVFGYDPNTATTFERPTSANVGDVVYIALAPAEGYLVTGTDITTADGTALTDEQWDELAIDDYNEDIFYFTMPAYGLLIHVTYTPIPTEYAINLNYVPEQVDLAIAAVTGDAAPGYATEGNAVFFTYEPIDGWGIVSVTVTNDTTGETIPFEDHLLPGSNTEHGYRFIMPASSVTIKIETAVGYDISYSITYNEFQGTLWTYPGREDIPAGTVVTVEVNFPQNQNSRAKIVVTTVPDGTAVAYDAATCTFIMPASDVLVHATFEAIPEEGMLTLSKTVVGAPEEDADKTFAFHLKMTIKNADITNSVNLIDIFNNYGVDADERDAIITALNNAITTGQAAEFTFETTLYLKNGQSVEFKSLRTGSTYEITEAGTPGYTPAANGQTGTLGGSLTVSGEIDGDTTIAFTNTYKSSVEGPYFKGHGLALGDAINVRFNLALPGGKDLYEGSYVEFMIENATGTKRYVTADAVQVANDPDNDNPRYRYVCPVNAIQMADMITPVFHYTVDGEERTIQGTPYAAKTYIDKHKDEAEDAYRNAVRATGDYGHFAQIYLHDVHQDTYGTHAEMPLYGSGSYDYNAIYGLLADLEIVRPLVGDMEKITTLLYCDSQTGIWLYLRLKDGYAGPTPTATYNGTTVDMSLNTADGRYRYKIPGSMASELDQMKNVTLTVGADSTVVKVAVLSWVRGSLGSNASANEKNFASSLYAYWKAAVEYQAAHPAN
jgi:hypothetical protein